MRSSLAILVCLLTALPASSEPLEFAIYHVTDEGRTLLDQDSVDYSVQDIDVVRWGGENGHPGWKKSLKLADGFSIGVLVYGNDEVSAIRRMATFSRSFRVKAACG